MPDWIAITGAITNVATAIDLGYRYHPNEAIYGKDAEKILKQVDEILNHSNIVLENHKDILDGDVYDELKDKYRRFHWQMTDESQGQRAIRDQIIRQSRILSQLYASKESRQLRAQDLLGSVEEYQTSVLSASEAAHLARKGKKLAMFPDARNPPEDAVSAPKSFTSWFSVFGRPSRQGEAQTDVESARSLEVTSPSSPPSSFGGTGTVSTIEEGFIVAVTHLPDTDPPTSSTGSDSNQPATLYRRMISFEGAGKRIDVIDPKRHSLSENGAYIGVASLEERKALLLKAIAADEEALRAMTLLGERLLNDAVPVGSHVTDAGADGSLESTIEGFRRMSTAGA